jgi:hypothetical protein
MGVREGHFNRVTLLSLAGLLCAGIAQGDTCPAEREVRLAGIAGAYAVSEATVLAIRHHDWWTTPSTGFYVTWDWSETSSLSQHRLLHAAMGYHASQAGAAAFRWACLGPTPAAWLGAALGVAVNLPKEIGDGLHQDHGFSMPGMLWTALGSAVPALHQTWPVSRAFALKVNYWPSEEFWNRPGLEPQLESDYAGQHYYLAIAPSELNRNPWPQWLGLAMGHSVPYWASRPPVHQWYASLDVNFRGLPVHGVWWRRVAWVLDQVHFPLPGVRLQQGTWTVGLF